MEFLVTSNFFSHKFSSVRAELLVLFSAQPLVLASGWVVWAGTGKTEDVREDKSTK